MNGREEMRNRNLQVDIVAVVVLYCDLDTVMALQERPNIGAAFSLPRFGNK